MTNFEKVGTFMKTFGQEVKLRPSMSSAKINKLRLSLIKEEFDELENAMNKKELFTNKIYNTPQKRIKNQKSLDNIVNNWTKKNTIQEISKKLSKHNVPWGHVKTFGDFLKTKTARNFITSAKINDKIIKVPKCAIETPKKNVKSKTIVPQVGQDNSKILKSIGYTRKKIDILKKKNII